jgi:hypothetical protein
LRDTEASRQQLLEIHAAMEAQRIEDERLISEEIARREKEFETRLKVEHAKVEAEHRRHLEIQQLADEQKLKEKEAELAEQRQLMESKLMSVSYCLGLI